MTDTEASSGGMIKPHYVPAGGFKNLKLGLEIA
jgi:hypothetical protein